MRLAIRISLALALLLSAPLFAASYTVGTPGASSDNNTGSDFTATLPASFSAGNLLLGCTRSIGNAETFTTPTDWTILHTHTNARGSIVVYAKVAVGSDSAPNISWSGGTHVWNQIVPLSGDEYTDLATIVAHSASSDQTGNNIVVPGLTISTADTLVIACGGRNKTATSNGATVTISGAYASIGTGVFTGSRQAVGWGYEQQTTATSATQTTWDVSIDENVSGSGVTVSLKSLSVTPTFTSAPAIGTRTTSSLPINFTSDTTGTVYGARLTDGSSTPTCDALEIGTGYVQVWSEAVVATVADAHTFSSITDGTVTDGYFCIEDGSGNDSAVASIANMYKLPAFTTALTVASQTDTTYTSNSKVLDGPGVVDLVACLKDASPPSVSQVEARTGGCILSGATDDATGTMTLNPSGGDFPVYDLYYVGSYGSQHEAAVHTLVDECLSAPSGKQIINCPAGLTSIGTGSPIEALNTAITPDIAIGDIPICDSVTDPDAFAVAVSVAGQFSYSGDDSRQYVNCTFYDLSVGVIHADDLDAWFNNLPPIPPEPDSLIFFVPLNSAMTPVDLTSYCIDPEGDVITVTNVDALPTGLSISANTLQGTATVRGKTLNITLRCADAPGDSVDWE